jgi:hypothetical protein
MQIGNSRNSLTEGIIVLNHFFLIKKSKLPMTGDKKGTG